ncbi:trypsin-like peptidase domain-containing protein [Anaerocolumna sp. MB42-C2]|uniref:trypsin-like peptidase domain-containing protein n=1 Tax=Anaerocolumna sp. MB42-C2 TaxID=3070997 RepID=UPI0027E17E8B|nr:trypsin-like peptidase domain-containing protein [Anaerocolumna sp. MB42-C2]WMJ90401.1 trypsin-like peptidase domain-containing protein [Anaerocolumna sp. MB42-C2]
MIKIKKMSFTIAMALCLSAAIPVSTPFYSNVEEAYAAAVKLNVTKTSVYIGDTVKLKLSGTSMPIKWSSSDKSIAKVSASGMVTGLKKGMVKVTAAVGTKKYISTITVQKKILTAEQIYEKCSKATVEILAEVDGEKYNLGSGFFLDNGKVVTNLHVIAGADKIQVTNYNGTTFDVQQVLGYDAAIDLAVLKINSKNDFLIQNQEGVTAGESVYILGSPLGLTGSFADGMVSSTSRKLEGVDYIQVTAPMSPGNSGGPLINRYGEVMGINTWQFADGQNLNFSININEISEVNTDNPVSVSEFQNLTESYREDADEEGTAYSSSDSQEVHTNQLTDLKKVSDILGALNGNLYAAAILIPNEDGTSYKWILPQ